MFMTLFSFLLPSDNLSPSSRKEGPPTEVTMTMQLLVLALSAIQAVMAGTLFTDLIVTDVDQGPGACIRMPQYTTNTTAPVTDLTSSDMACGMLSFFYSVRFKISMSDSRQS